MSSHAAITRIWPLPAVADLDDAQLIDALAVEDRARRSVRMNFVSSADGAVTEDGRSGGLSGSADKRVFGILRRLCDVVLVGAGTVREEGYGPMQLGPTSVDWRRRHGLAPQPVFAVVSGALALDPDAEMFTQAPVRMIVVTIGSSPQD
jgi:riboflavin biosynthesis pyrimidine reductase